MACYNNKLYNMLLPCEPNNLRNFQTNGSILKENQNKQQKMQVTVSDLLTIYKI